MQPKNSQRRDAITSKTYCELRTATEVDEFFSELLRSNLRMEVAGRESAIRMTFVQAASGQSASLFLEAPDIHFAAAVML
jgi:hypothetical protein